MFMCYLLPQVVNVFLNIVFDVFIVIDLKKFRANKSWYYTESLF